MKVGHFYTATAGVPDRQGGTSLHRRLHSIEWLIKRLIKIGARVSYHAKKWRVHVASAFPLAHYYRAVLGYG